MYDISYNLYSLIPFYIYSKKSATLFKYCELQFNNLNWPRIGAMKLLIDKYVYKNAENNMDIFAMHMCAFIYDRHKPLYTNMCLIFNE